MNRARTYSYLGIQHDGTRELFMASAGPIDELKGVLYVRIVGPFSTQREARMQLRLPAGTFGRDGVIACIECSRALNVASSVHQVLTLTMPIEMRVGARCSQGHVTIAPEVAR